LDDLRLKGGWSEVFVIEILQMRIFVVALGWVQWDFWEWEGEVGRDNERR
jgi:hypothetical protein